MTSITKSFDIGGVHYLSVGSMRSYPGACQMAEEYKRQTNTETFIAADDNEFYVIVKDNKE